MLLPYALIKKFLQKVQIFALKKYAVHLMHHLQPVEIQLVKEVNKIQG